MERFNMSMRKYLKEVGVTSPASYRARSSGANFSRQGQTSGPNGSDSYQARI